MIDQQEKYARKFAFLISNAVKLASYGDRFGAGYMAREAEECLDRLEITARLKAVVLCNAIYDAMQEVQS